MNGYIDNRVKDINKAIQPYLLKNDGGNDYIIEIMSYAFNPGGKRLRPLLLLLTYEMLTASNDACEKVAPYMAALEMIHTSSLIHDDLPALDNDALRRGKPSTHVQYGENLAILAGDGMLNLAYETLFDELSKHPHHYNIMACKTIADSGGVFGVIAGQVADVLAEDQKITENELAYIHTHKTAKLITASFVAAGHISKSNEIILEKLERIGEMIGLAFQIQDDVLDQIGSEDTLGKPINSDEKNDKNTYVSIHGIQKAQVKYEQLFDESIDMIEALNPVHSTHLVNLITYVKNRKH